MKFRVWCKDGNEWEKHGVVIREDGQLLHMGAGRVTPLGAHNHIVEFSTGLRDKNGNEIYEGDIVTVKYCDNDNDMEENTTVAWNGGAYSPFSWNYSCDGCNCSTQIYSVEVIGNIHDNPELLESKE